MAKLTEYQEATGFDEGDILIKDGVGGTKKIPVSVALADMAQNKADIAHIKSGMFSLLTADAVTINATSENPVDLNDATYLAPGSYKVNTTDAVKYVANAPFAAAFRMFTLEVTYPNTSTPGQGRIVQIAFSPSVTNDIIAIRTYGSTLFSKWHMLATHDYIMKNSVSLPIDWTSGRWRDDGSDVVSTPKYIKNSTIQTIETNGHKSIIVVANTKNLPAGATKLRVNFKELSSSGTVIGTPTTIDFDANTVKVETNLNENTRSIKIQVCLNTGNDIDINTEYGRRLMFMWGEDAAALLTIA